MKRTPRLIVIVLLGMMLSITTGCENQPSVPAPHESAELSSSAPTPTAPNKEEAPQVEDQERHYQSALTHLENGETCAAYQDLATLGEYKNTPLLKEEIYLQNQLGFITLGATDYFRDNREAFALLPKHLIDETFANKTWIVPNFQSHRYLEYVLASDHSGEVYDPFLGENIHDITWMSTEYGFRIGNPDIITDQDEIHYQTEIRKAAEGVYLFYVLDALKPYGGSDIVCYIDKESVFGKRYIKTNAIIMDVIQNPATQWRVLQDPYGLYFIVQESAQ